MPGERGLKSGDDNNRSVGEEMKINSRNKKLLLVAFALLLAVSGLAAGNKVMSQEKSNDELIDISVITHYPASLAQGVQRALIKNKLSVADIGIINFYLPDTDGYRTHYKTNVFSPEGGQVGKVNLEYLSKFSDESYLITLANRISNAATEKSDLIAILPEINEVICTKIEQAYRGSGGDGYVDIPELAKINLIPHPQEIPDSEVATLPFRSGCVKISGGGYYYYHLLLER